MQLPPPVAPQGPLEQAEPIIEAAAAADREAEIVQARPLRISWASMLERVFDNGLQHGRHGGGAVLKIIAAIPERPVIEVRILAGAECGCGRLQPPAAPRRCSAQPLQNAETLVPDGSAHVTGLPLLRFLELICRGPAMTLLSHRIAATAFVVTALAAPLAASAADTNFALLSEGASFVSASSIIADGTLGLTVNATVMQNNLLTDTPGVAVSNGDTRYIFGSFDPDGTVEVDLGQVRLIDSLGAKVQLPSGGDRFVVGPFHASVSLDGLNYSPFGSPLSSVPITLDTVNPVSLLGPLQSVRFVRYSFGPDSLMYAGNGGSAIYQVFATGPSAPVPEPSSWAMLLLGIAGAGAMLRRRPA